MSHELPKTYDPAAIEPRWAEYWEREKLFHLETSNAVPGKMFNILLPPPNVTGNLHMGHMFEHTESDILVRWHRMRGESTLWLPGTDHAGIATQMLVERQLASEGVKRLDLGREKFVARVWEWRQHYGGNILKQMKRLGDSVDWSREYFTMDENLSRAVREVFVRLYEQGLIYRGEYIVNWCPRCLTAISDLEVVHEEQNGKLYEIRYPLVDGEGYVHIATTRPETMLGDVAVAVNPNDERYRHLIGKKLRLPLMNREIPIIADELANPEFGTGAVKVTPAHDPNDFIMGKRHNLPMLKIMDDSARINAAGGVYAGLDRYEARTRVLADLAAQDFLVGTKEHVLALGKCDRCKTVIEPMLSMQWFLKIQPLADKAIAAVEQGHIRFTPENYKTIYLNWMYKIYDWCISRQLWWGHRIPAWHCGNCRQMTIARHDPARCAHCGSTDLTQETDVLDTWFSSALLPFTTLGWPEHTRDLDIFYPTTLLITGFDILFFWVARMIMMGCHFMQDFPAAEGKPRAFGESVPFREVHIHALVRDAERQKMSKTKGNVMDPIAVTEKYGTDAVRFTLAAMASPGTDIAFNESRTEGYRNFANKIWNAARFMFLNIDRATEANGASGDLARHLIGEGKTSNPSATADGTEQAPLPDRWIAAQFQRTAFKVNQSLAEYRFDEAANLVYQFFWGDLCDWYIEAVKPRLDFSAEAGESGRAALGHLMRVFEASLRLLSPFMPFITEEIWHALYRGDAPAKSIALSRYPFGAALSAAQQNAITEMELLQKLIVDIRNRRAELKIEPKQKVPIRIFVPQPQTRALIEANRDLLANEKMAGVDGVEFAASSLAGEPGVQAANAYEVVVVYEKNIDAAVERERLSKELKKLEGEHANAQRQLGNESFLAKAPPHVVDGLRRRHAELEKLLPKTRMALEEVSR